MKISYKLILIFIFIALMPIVGVGYLSFREGKSIIQSDIEHHLLSEAKELMGLIDRVMQSRQQDIIMLSNNSVLQDENSKPEEIKKILLSLKLKNPDYASLSFFNMNRVRLIDTENLDIGKQHEMVPYWEDVLLGKVSAGRDIRIAEELKIPIIYFAAPVHNFSGKPIGAAVARFNPIKINSLITSFRLQEEEREESEVILINHEKDIIFSSAPYYRDKILKEKMDDLRSVQMATEGQEGVLQEFYPPYNKRVLTAFVQEQGFYDFIGNNWHVITISNVEKSLAPVVSFKNQILTFSIAFLILVIFIGVFYGRTIVAPIEQLAVVAQRVGAGNFKERGNIKSKDEIGLLAKVFNGMLDDLEKLDEAKTSFISIASHQLRTPLSSMRWITEMLLNGDLGPLSEEQKSFVKDIGVSNQRLINLVNALLASTRLEAGRVTIEPVPLNLLKSTNEILETLQGLINAKQLKVALNSIPPVLPTINLEPEAFRQVVLNLVSNAINYTANGGAVTINLELKDDHILFSVKDTGIGIPKKDQPRIFEKFFRADNAVSVMPDGTGLGLSLAKALVLGWKGKIWFESEEGKGSTFFFTIPLAGIEAKKGEVGLTT